MRRACRLLVRLNKGRADLSQRIDARRNPPGAEKLRRRDTGGADVLDRWLVDVERAFVGRILPVDSDVAGEWGRMSAIRTVPVVDCLLAATAEANDLTLVTRNVRDTEGLGAKIVDPFAARKLKAPR